MLIIPYTRSSQSGVAHIGMSFGIPIIASRVGGLEESLGKYGGTRFVEPMDPGKLAEAMKIAISGNKSYEVPDELRWNTIAGLWNNLIKGLLHDTKQ